MYSKIIFDFPTPDSPKMNILTLINLDDIFELITSSFFPICYDKSSLFSEIRRKSSYK